MWDWYAERRAGLQDVQPNAGHLALADFERRHPGRLTLITQNVDGLHQRAGSSGVLALHGNIFEDRWLDDCALARRPQDACNTEQALPGRPPRCGQCGNLLRPGVVMLVVGTAGAVYPAAGLAHQARAAGAQVVIVNPHPSELDDVAHHVLAGTAATLLPQLLGS